MPTPFAPSPSSPPAQWGLRPRSARLSATRVSVAVWTVLFLFMGIGFGGLTAVISGGQAARASVDPGAAAPLYDLEGDEVIGGHTIERHVGRTDRDLADRLRREPQISAASTYTDLITARRVVGAAVAQSRTRIETWAARSGPRPNLVLNYAEPGGRGIGRALRRGGRVASIASRVLVVLRWQERQRRWIVLTSYPEAR